jgi:hypothetical protein
MDVFSRFLQPLDKFGGTLLITLIRLMPIHSIAVLGLNTARSSDVQNEAVSVNSGLRERATASARSVSKSERLS